MIDEHTMDLAHSLCEVSQRMPTPHGRIFESFPMMTNQEMLVQCFKNCRWMNAAGEIKDGAYAQLFAELTDLMTFTPRPLEEKEVYRLMVIPYTGECYDD